MEKQAAPPRPHWRRRDPSDAEVYVVHPTQFRTVVQQLTGAPPGTAHHPHHVGANNDANNAAPALVAAESRGGGTRSHEDDDDNNNNGSVGRGTTTTTLGQMHQECMAWAAQDDHDQH